MLFTEAGDVSAHVKPASNQTVNSQQLEGLRRSSVASTLDSLSATNLGFTVMSQSSNNQ